MLWIKAFHVIFIVSWFSGLFYLPRIFVNLSLEEDPGARARLLTMARKLYRFMFYLAVVALGLGAVLWLYYGIGLHGPGNAWLHAKLFFVALVLGYHHACGRLLAKFEAGSNRHSDRWYRIFNEVPVLLLAAIVILVIVKPF